ncbi:MAG: hypothetical protein M0Z42_01750 [Actinomycetota bacterium]|nr:hypothetical protein [Actinomycetota bacterium]
MLSYAANYPIRVVHYVGGSLLLLAPVTKIVAPGWRGLTWLRRD